jgi:crossover junction endodeoxyribonuclease RusA
MGRVGVRIVAYQPDHRRRDLDNMLKAPLDALQSAGVFENDGDIDDLHILRALAVDVPRLDCTVWEMPA